MKRVLFLLAPLLLVAATTACEPAPPPVRPNASNTGPTSPVSSLAHRTPAQVEGECSSDGLVEHVYIDGGNVDPSSNCTIRDFVLDGKQAYYGIRTINGQTGVRVEDGEIFNIASTGGYGAGVTYMRIHVHDSGADGFKPRNGTVIAHSYCHNIGKNTGAHADCVQFDGPDGSSVSNVAILWNNFDLDVADLVSPYKANAAVQVNDQIRLNNVTIAYNWLVGGNFTLNCNNSYPGGPMLNIDDNIFEDTSRYGPYGGGCSNPDNEGNTYNGQPLAIR